MSVFAVMSEIPRPELREAIEREFPDKHYHWSNTVSFIVANGTPRANAARLGIKNTGEDGTVRGSIDQSVVFMVSAQYFGWSKLTLWEWLKPALENTDQ